MIVSVSDSWICLCVAILFGVFGTISMKLSHGLQKWKPTACLFIFYMISFFALTLALRGIDMSIVYTIWSGVGTVIVAIIGVLIFGESASWQKSFSLLFIVIGVIGIHLSNVLI